MYEIVQIMLKIKPKECYYFTHNTKIPTSLDQIFLSMTAAIHRRWHSFVVLSVSDHKTYLPTQSPPGSCIRISNHATVVTHSRDTDSYTKQTHPQSHQTDAAEKKKKNKVISMSICNYCGQMFNPFQQGQNKLN
jgi:hypothetical protein